MKKLIALIILLTGFSSAFAQQPVEMADKMRSQGEIYVVIAVIAIVFVGLAIYLFMMDNRLKKLENDK